LPGSAIGLISYHAGRFPGINISGDPAFFDPSGFSVGLECFGVTDEMAMRDRESHQEIP